MYTFNPRAIKRIEQFGNLTFAESGSDKAQLDLTDDLMAIIVHNEFDVSISTAANPYLHGVNALNTSILIDIDGAEERVRGDGYGLTGMSTMYSRRPPMNMIHGATGNNQILGGGMIIPCQVMAERGKHINYNVIWGTELVLDSEAANIAINSGTQRVAGVFGKITDESWLIKYSDAFGVQDYEAPFPSKDKFIEQAFLYGDTEKAAAEYDVIDKIMVKAGANILITLRKELISVAGWYMANRLQDAEQHLLAAYSIFHNDNISRGLALPIPSAKIADQVRFVMDRAASNNVYASIMFTKPTPEGGEEPVTKKAEGTSLKTPVT